MGDRYGVTPINVEPATSDLLEALRLLVEIPQRTHTEDTRRPWSYDYTEWGRVHRLLPTVILAVHHGAPTTSLLVYVHGEDQEDVTLYALEAGILQRFHAREWTTDLSGPVAQPRYEATHSLNNDEDVEKRVSAWHHESVTLQPGDLARRVRRQLASYHYDGLVPPRDHDTPVDEVAPALARLDHGGGLPRNPRSVPIRSLLDQYEIRLRLGNLGAPLPMDPQGVIRSFVAEIASDAIRASSQGIAQLYERKHAVLAAASIHLPATAAEFVAEGLRRG